MEAKNGYYAERLGRTYDGVCLPLSHIPDGCPDFLRQGAQKAPDNVALITTVKAPLFGRQTRMTTYGELDRLSDALAAALVDLGLKKGDRVAVIMPNIVAFIISYYAVLKAGGVVAATNPTYPAEKLNQINVCGAPVSSR
jgi:long-chain acyl-CoA synthetase